MGWGALETYAYRALWGNYSQRTMAQKRRIVGDGRQTVSYCRREKDVFHQKLEEDRNTGGTKKVEFVGLGLGELGPTTKPAGK